MIHKVSTLLIVLLISICSNGQNSLTVVITDSLTKQAVYGASVHLKELQIGGFSDENGVATISNIPNGTYPIDVSAQFYESTILTIKFPILKGGDFRIVLTPMESELDEIIIEATRANRTVANLPTRTEVLTEEIDEAASMEPSKISHLITHSTGIQVQTTAAASNGAVVRIQGLNGRYTQLLKDGFPLYGGLSGSMDILQIPPLDLRQVEYVKGSASTLYGGGAIGGLINLLTKRATKDETLLHINMSHIGAKDFNTFVSRKFGRFGFTNLASFHLQAPYDADGDLYTDVPEVRKFNFNPKLFFFPDSKTEIYLGANISNEGRKGGDLNLINNLVPDSLHFFLDDQKSSRYTSQFSAKRRITRTSTLTIKNSISLFDRYISIRTNAIGDLSRFSGKQLNSFSELNYNLNKPTHNLNIGLNVYTNKFSEKLLDTVQLRDQEFFTVGGYINYLWDISKKVALESGLRADYSTASSEISKSSGETFILPRLSAIYKINRSFSLRLGGGMGYRMPTIFNEEAEPFGYKNVQAIDFENLKAERSYGGNIDFKFRNQFGSDNVLFTFNQMFFYNLIEKPILLMADTNGILTYANTTGTLNSRGFETQLKLTVWKFTWFLGYTYTDAYLLDENVQTNLILTPQHSVKGDLLFVIDNKWRIGWDYEYKSEQLLSSGLNSPTLFSTGVVVERTLDNFVVFLNAENFTDTRQTRYESLIDDVTGTPQFTDVWAPLDGFFFNAGLKIKL